MNEAIRTQISAFVDGELPHNEAELLLRRMCQDRELRQQAAEYLALGRAMRGDRVTPGMDKLRSRIAASLDDHSLMQEEAVAVAAKNNRYLRPVAGIAIAATVAVAAILGLQQIASLPGDDPLAGSETVADAADSSYTVPDQADDQLRDYYLRHSASSSEFGANSINTRLVTLQLYEDQSGEGPDAEQVDDVDAATGESGDTADNQTP